MTTTRTNAFDPKDAVVVVTGGGSGIGKAFCQAFAERGASTVVVVDLHLNAARKVADTLPNGVGVAMRANVAIEMDVRKIIRRTEFEHGPISAFVANAGIPSNGGVDVPNDEWNRIWNVNVMQHVFAARHLFPLYEKRKEGGSFLITASAAGLLTQIGSLPYSVTKHAALSVAEWLHITYKSRGIHVSCLAPQAVRSGMTVGAEEGGVAGEDGVLDPLDVANESIDAMERGMFLILPHKRVKVYFERKAKDYERWLRGMQRMQAMYGDIVSSAPNTSNARL